MNLSLRPPILSTLIILLLTLIFPVLAQQNGGGGAYPFSQSPYRIGERLTYNISFSSFPSAAHAELHVVSRGVYFGRDAIQLRAHLETTGLVNVALLAINNDYTSYIEPETGLPFRSYQIARDALKAGDSVEDFNQPGGNEAIPPQQQGAPGTYDLLSAFYRARALPLAQGAVYNFSVHNESASYEAELRVVGHETITTSVGSFNAIATQVRVSQSPLRNLRIYFSDDETHIPVLLTARLSAGQLRAELAASQIVQPPPAAAAAPTSDVKPGPMPRPAPVVTPTPAAVPPRGNEDWPFTIGEQLNYQIFIGGTNTPMGIATFQVRGRSKYFDRDGLYFNVLAQTTNAAARIFIARDQLESYVDPRALLPYRTVLALIEGQRHLNQTVLLNQEAGTATATPGKRIDIPVGTHDYLSFFYAVRTFNLTPTRKSAIPMLVENKPKTIFVNAIQREAIQLGERKIPAIAVSLTTDDPEPDKYQFRMWISDDKRRLPLRITCATQLGPLRADLAILPAAPQ